MDENEKKHGHDHEKHVLHFTINGERRDWHEEYITGAKIKELGSIPANEEVFLSVKKPWEDELIEDDKKVNLALPGVEHFYSKPRDITLIVNGSPKKWAKREISFVEVIVLAYGTYIDKPTMVYTVGYEDGPKQNPEGSMVKGQVVIVKNKMIFHATATDKS